MGSPHLLDIFRLLPMVGDAAAVPEDDPLARLGGHPVASSIGHKQDFLLRRDSTTRTALEVRQMSDSLTAAEELM